MLTKNRIRFLVVGLFLISALLISEITKSYGNFTVYAQKWYLNPDGEWVAVVQANNTRSRIRYIASVGEVVDLPVWAFNHENTSKIITKKPTALNVIAIDRYDPRNRRLLHIPSPKQLYQNPLQVTVTAVGPFMNAIGLSWLGNQDIQKYQIWRREGNNPEKLIAYIDASNVSYQDDSVKPNMSYTYRIVAQMYNRPVRVVKLGVYTPPELPAKSLMALSGKGIIVYIDPSDSRSPFYFKKLTPKRIMEYCERIGFRYVQLRTVYGSYSHFNNKDLMNWLSTLLEEANNHKVAVIAWSIPRRDSTNAIAEDIVVAGTRSLSGNAIAGSSLDLETGSDYMGSLPGAKQEITKYAQTFRKAVGKNYLLSAIVFTPWVTGYTNEVYPYKELAEVSDVLQPMVFWHHFYTSAHHYYSSAEVMQYIANSVNMTRMMAEKDIPINVIGQSIDLGNTGIPNREEIIYAMQAAAASLAIGVSFFAWNEALISQSRESGTAEAIMDFMW